MMEFVNVCLLFFIYQFQFSVAVPVKEADGVYHSNATCRRIMKENGLTEQFPGSVAHGIHSITVEDIRYYFKHDATEDNAVPTVNYDLRSNAPLVLPHATVYGYDTSFRSIGMRHLDQVLKDMEKKEWYLSNYSTLEKLIHTIHMNEMWTRTKMHFDSIGLLPYNPDLCACLNDVENNGVMQVMRLLALKIRYPGFGKVYTFGFSYKFSPELEKFGKSSDVENMKKAAMGVGDQGMDHMVDEKSWSQWKDVMKNMSANQAHNEYEAAMFLHCALR